MNVVVSSWIDLGSLGDIPRQGARVVKTPAGCLALFRTADDRVFALEDRCPHKGGPLSQGIVHGDGVTCPLHNWVISLTDGQVRGADEGRVPTLRVRLHDDRVQIDAASLASWSART
ncbi:MAG: nitrite reductase small subunit NirD [Alphaproteobacteria bacterium]